jgi:hypothetical protein
MNRASDPRSAVYVKTGKENALCTFEKIRNLVDGAMECQGHAMDKLGIPKFTVDMLAHVRDFHHKTPGSGLMTLNSHFWGKDHDAINKAQLRVLNTYKTRDECKAAIRVGKNVCLECLTGVVNHMAPGGQRMPELSSISLLEQESQKRRMLRFFSSQICVIVDYTKGEGLESSSDMEAGYWFGDIFVSCHILRIVSGTSISCSWYVSVVDN